jgi:transposase
MAQPNESQERSWTISTVAIERDGTVVLRVRSTREAVPCPACGELSRRRHSWYRRRALDLPWRGAGSATTPPVSCHTISQPYREIAALGYRRSCSPVATALPAWREDRPPPGPDGRRPRRRARVRRYAGRWLCPRPPEQSDDDEHRASEQVPADDPDLATGHALLQRFRRLLADRAVPALQAWRAAADQSPWPPFRRFARGLRADWAAVEAAFRLPWSNGPVEGEIHTVKLLKRQGYGRASLPLLRAKILAAWPVAARVIVPTKAGRRSSGLRESPFSTWRPHGVRWGRAGPGATSRSGPELASDGHERDSVG